MKTNTITIEKRSFHNLKETHFKFLDLVTKENQYNPDNTDEGYIYDAMDYRAVSKYSQNLGHVFFAKAGEVFLGFMLCFDSTTISRKKFPLGHLSNFLKHEWRFIESLSIIGSFCFIDQFAVRKEFRGKKIAKKLVAAIELHAEKYKVTIMAAAIHEYNHLALKFLKQNDFFFTDFYQNQVGQQITWWFRVIKILNSQNFLQAINPKKLPSISDLIIPIQLNQTTKNINALISRLGAKIIWSSFFHYKNEMLSSVLGLKKNHNGYYDPILSCDRTNYTEVISVLKELSNYLNQKDESQQVASLSKSFYKEGFELILLNDDAENHELPAFTNPIAFNISNINIPDLFHKLNLGHYLEDANAKEKNEWNNIVIEKCKPIISEEKEKLWQNWTRKKWLTPKEQKKLLILGNKLKNNQRLDPNEKKTWEQFRERKILKEENYQKWEKWIAINQKLFESDKKSDFYIAGKTIWCHAIIPMSFTGGLSGIIFSFMVQKQELPNFQRIVNDLAYTISDAFAKNIFNVILKLQNSVTEKYLHRFAIATIMARNLSHNLGSHVLSKASSISIIKKYVYSRRRNRVEGLETITGLNNYLQSRMDFLADIAWSEPVTNFSKYFHKDIIQSFTQQRFLLEQISSADIDAVEINPGKGDEYKDTLVQIPNGNLGNHAIFTILENIIRNITKHEQTQLKNKSKLTLFFEVERTPSDHFYKLTIFDDIPRDQTSKTLINKLNNLIDKPIVTKANKIRNHGLGLLEMCIAAAYLRGETTVDVMMNGSKSIPLLKAIRKKVGENRFYLGYELYLKTPKEILIISDTQEAANHTHINILSTEQFRSKKEEIFPHSFLLINDQQLIKDRGGNLPLRALVQQSKIFYKQLNVQEQLNFLWEQWVTKIGIQKTSKEPYLKFQINGDIINPELEPEILPISTTIFFDHHGDGIMSDKLQKKSPQPQEFLFYEPFNSTSPLGYLLRDWTNYSIPEQTLLKWQLIESGLTKVFILDERIQDECAQSLPQINIKDSTYFEQLFWMNIILPTPIQINLKQKYFSEDTIIDLYSMIEKEYAKSSIDFLVIHVGLLEKLFSSDQETINAIVRRTQKQFNKMTIVFITGRGKIMDLPKGVHFLNYSTISNYLFESKSKYHLTRILYATRTR